MLDGISNEVKMLLDVCSYNNKPIDETEVFNEFSRLEKEGYVLFDYAKEIIKEFYQMHFGPPANELICDYVFECFKKVNPQLSKDLKFSAEYDKFYNDGKYYLLRELKNYFSIDPETVIGELDRFEEISRDDLHERLVPLGIYSALYLVVGESHRIYAMAPGIYLLGENFVDFLNRYVRNDEPIRLF